MSSSSKEMSKFEKEKQKLVQEKCQGLLNEMLRDDDNKYCVDCDAKGPRWASWNLGIFLCIRCAGIHRNLGVHISRVKSVNLDSWTPEQVVTMQQMGNSRARAVYEANLPDNFRRPQTDVALENFIRAKYEHTKYIAQEWVKPAPPRVDWNAEIEEQIRKKKEKSRTDSNVVLPKIGSGKLTSPSNSKGASQVKKPLGKIEVPVPAPLPPVQATSASDDLLGLSTGGCEFSSDPFASPVKSTNSPVPAVSSSAPTPASDDLGSVFTSSGDGGAGGKMSKESILSLYGSLGGGFPGGGGGGGGATNQLIGGNTLVGNNPFVQGGGGGFGGAGGVGGVQATTNPFPGWGGAELGNGFGGMQSGGLPQQQQQSNVAQLQQGLFSLNLSTPSGMPPQQPPPSNSNMLFNTNNPNSTPNLNINPMANQGGFFTGLANTSISAPPQQMGIPPGQQFTSVPPQQPVTFNQFQSAMPAAPQPSSNVGYGVFQNGGSAGGGSGVNHVDLLWK